MNSTDRYRAVALEWPLRPALFKLWWPLFVATQLSFAGDMISAIYLGQRLGPEALTVVTLISPLRSLVNWFFAGISQGAAVLVSQAVGARSGRGLLLMGNAVRMAAISGVLLAVMGLALGSTLTASLSSTPSIRSALNEYLFPLLISLPFLGVTDVIIQAANASGWTRLGLFRRLFEIALMIVAVPILVQWLGLGAVASSLTSLATLVLLVFVLPFAIRRNAHALELGQRSATGWEFRIWKTIAFLGVPLTIGRVALYVAQLIYLGLIRPEGNLASGGFGLAFTLGLLLASVPLSIGAALGVIIGQSAGEGNVQRAMSAFRQVLGVQVVVAVGLFVAMGHPEPLLRIFTGDVALLASAARSARLLRWSVLCIPVYQSLFAAYISLGAVRVPGFAMALAHSLGVLYVLIDKRYLGSSPLLACSVGVTFAQWATTVVAVCCWRTCFSKPLSQCALKAGRDPLEEAHCP